MPRLHPEFVFSVSLGLPLARAIFPKKTIEHRKVLVELKVNVVFLGYFPCLMHMCCLLRNDTCWFRNCGGCCVELRQKSFIDVSLLVLT
jgi:hypothetical protein